jgi:UDP-N-acetylmuramate--alanine ligase
MSGIAEVLLNLGYEVSGSDLATSPVVRRLKRLGAKVTIGHRARNVERADVVVISSAVQPDNVEVVEARRAGMPVIPRAEMLAELMRMKYGVAVAGSHGKTSTTTMIAAVLHGCGLDPTIVVGGRVSSLGSGARLGKGELMVAEADESDGSFLKLQPTVAVVTNIDREHLDHYRDLDEIKETFVQFLARIPFYGAAVLCLDDANVQSILPRLERRYVTYGFSGQADLQATDLVLKGFTARYDVRSHGRRLGQVRLPAPGRHSVLNSLAALAVGMEFGLDFSRMAEQLEVFKGADRRFQLRGKARDVMVVDDYGHHPAEILATLEAAREAFGRRLVVAFQPHRFSRTQALEEEFLRSFNEADVLVVTEIYPAGEAPIPGITGRRLAEGIERHGHRDVTYVEALEDVAGILARRVRAGDLVLTLGAGSIWRAGTALLKLLGGSAARSRKGAPS